MFYLHLLVVQAVLPSPFGSEVEDLVEALGALLDQLVPPAQQKIIMIMIIITNDYDNNK